MNQPDSDFESVVNVADTVLQALRKPQRAAAQLRKAAREGDQINVHERLRELHEELLKITCVIEKTEKAWVSR